MIDDVFRSLYINIYSYKDTMTTTELTEAQLDDISRLRAALPDHEGLKALYMYYTNTGGLLSEQARAYEARSSLLESQIKELRAQVEKLKAEQSQLSYAYVETLLGEVHPYCPQVLMPAELFKVAKEAYATSVTTHQKLAEAERTIRKQSVALADQATKILETGEQGPLNITYTRVYGVGQRLPSPCQGVVMKPETYIQLSDELVKLREAASKTLEVCKESVMPKGDWTHVRLSAQDFQDLRDAHDIVKTAWLVCDWTSNTGLNPNKTHVIMPMGEFVDNREKRWALIRQVQSLKHGSDLQASKILGLEAHNKALEEANKTLGNSVVRLQTVVEEYKSMLNASLATGAGLATARDEIAKLLEQVLSLHSPMARIRQRL